ncbi:glutathione peroxidase [Winogradskyella immobilis]|uniref:Glutathione peroxidase n=1 Tax=Winogradskyella immobilis TaxID=2816852 RepID=A0ABS8EMQ2_9FLAO|nr:glutathione peroxidase [Winogradskyella immobilis]MCC1484277.1 glutathione peroxidase [Winogradskyella immobilis]MCG0016369.1 glutathione peroxidase [Winogradskyella immobilis]
MNPFNPFNPFKAFNNTLSATNKAITNKVSIYNIEIKDLEGQSINLLDYKGKKILFVNVASKCGFTPQYRELQKLQDTYSNKLAIIGVPCNQFGKQEPGNSKEIQEFCKVNYGVTFLITEKVNVKGSQQHPLYNWLTNKTINGKENSTVKWNFQKYLVDENGVFLDYFYSITKPMSSKIINYLK